MLNISCLNVCFKGRENYVCLLICLPVHTCKDYLSVALNDKNPLPGKGALVRLFLII